MLIATRFHDCLFGNMGMSLKVICKDNLQMLIATTFPDCLFGNYRGIWAGHSRYYVKRTITYKCYLQLDFMVVCWLPRNMGNILEAKGKILVGGNVYEHNILCGDMQNFVDEFQHAS